MPCYAIVCVCVCIDIPPFVLQSELCHHPSAREIRSLQNFEEAFQNTGGSRGAYIGMCPLSKGVDGVALHFSSVLHPSAKVVSYHGKQSAKGKTFITCGIFD